MAVATRRRSVVFPAPFGPRTSRTSPRSTERSTRTTAGATPNTRVTPNSETAGISVGSSVAGRPAASTLLIPREATRRTGYRSPFTYGAPTEACPGPFDLRNGSGRRETMDPRPGGRMIIVRPGPVNVRRPLRRLVALGSLLLPMAGCRFGAPPGDTEQGQKIGNLYHLMFYIAIGVAAIVYLLILWCIVRYRRKGDDLPPQFRYHVPLEIPYKVSPALIVVGIFVATFRAENRVDAVAANPTVIVNVTAFQRQWRFQYPMQHVQIV